MWPPRAVASWVGRAGSAEQKEPQVGGTNPSQNEPRAIPSALEATLAELATGFSFALDAAEGREPGHATKVTYIATLLGQELGCDAADQRATFYAALLHDVGVPIAASGLTGLAGVDEELLFGFAPLSDFDAAEVPYEQRNNAKEVLGTHVSAAATFLSHPWFPPETQTAVRHSHENWDGTGYPLGAAGEDVPIVARILRAADLFECVVSGESNPLAARAHARSTILGWLGRELQPEITRALLDLTEDDVFWLGFYDDGIADSLIENAPEGVPASGTLLRQFSNAVADLIDAKSGHQPRRARRVARYVAAMADALGMQGDHAALLELIALWNDVGAFGVPNRILVKPDLLSLDEMQRMRTHPTFSAEIVSRIGVLRGGARWVHAHHERVDGKGYPETLVGPGIPTEAGILSLADAYVAMTARRPYRDAMTQEDATAVIEAGAGSQWDPYLVQAFLDVLVADDTPDLHFDVAGA